VRVCVCVFRAHQMYFTFGEHRRMLTYF